MKKSVRNVMLLGASLFTIPLTFACSNDNSDVKQPSAATQVSVSVSADNLNVDFNSNTTEINVTANADWSIRTDAAWISLRPSGGVKNETTTVRVTIDANKTPEERSATLDIVAGGSTVKSINVNQSSDLMASASVSKITMSGEGSSTKITVTANGNWKLTSDADWLSVSPSEGSKGETVVAVTSQVNEGKEERGATLTLSCGNNITAISVIQLNYNIDIPEGYTLVWNDEFDGDTLSNDWSYEVQSSGWVNNELQNYVKTPVDGKNTVEVKDGFLKINCFKGSDGKIYSGRIYANVRSGWTYGYFEAKINLPSGKGTWPAFWMMPVNFTGWPDSGEMDIMEEVGCVPDEVSSSLHALGHYHANNTQITAARKLAGAEGNYHIYALEWTPDLITTYVDGIPLLNYANDGSGDINWPYHNPFYVILNLAWGGDWGGMYGVDESALPVSLSVDYVRVFQKEQP